MPPPRPVQAVRQNRPGTFPEDVRVSMGISFVSDEMEDLLEGGVKLTIPRIGLGPELALPVMKIVLHEEFEIKTLQAPLVPGHEQKGISSDHCGQNLRVVGFAILIVVEVLGQDDGGMLDFLGGSPWRGEYGNPENVDVLGNFLAQGSELAVRNARYLETRESRIKSMPQEQRDEARQTGGFHPVTEHGRRLQRQSKRWLPTPIPPWSSPQFAPSSRPLEN